MPQQPNILYLHSHDTGRYISSYGHDMPTPNLQRLAEEGVLFRNAHCAGPTCSPSRAALLSGQCPHSAGMVGLAHRGFAMFDYNQHLIHTLKPAGYTTALSGIQHVAAQAQTIGYDHLLTTDTRVNHNKAVAFIRQKHDQPWFLSVGFFETHRKFPDPDPELDDPRHLQPPAPLPDTPEVRQDMAAYRSSVRTLDQKIGMVLETLEQTGQTENTLVIATTDHGIAFPFMKCNLTQHGTGVMLILRGPGGFTGGQCIDALVSQIDLFPTLCDLLSIAPPQWLQGTSLMPLIQDNAQQVNDQIFSEVTYHAAYQPMRSVRTQRYNYIRRFDPDFMHPVLPNIDDSLSKRVICQTDYPKSCLPEHELYDLLLDPNETRNLADDPGHQAILANMQHRLNQWMRSTHDPIRKGFLPPPRGAQVNPQYGSSPDEKTTRH